MRSIVLMLILFFSMILLTSCFYAKYISVEVDVKENSPPVFRFSGYKNSEKPAYVYELRVISEYPDKKPIQWAIQSDEETILLQEVVYGVVPDGFHLSDDALSLEPGAEYLLNVYGSGLNDGLLTQMLYFIYKPGVTRWNLNEIIYAAVNVKENSPPIFRVSADENFETPAPVRSIAVHSDSERLVYWSFCRDDNEPGPVWLREITYGVVPDGFRESLEARSLKPDAEYRLQIIGGNSRYSSAEVYFTNKPGKYSLYSSP